MLPREPSPIPRASFASGRSRQDFENALLNQDTLFLTGGTAVGMDTPPRPHTPEKSFEHDMSPVVGVVPPTPSTTHSRRPSQVTVGSDTPTRRAKGPSVGLDGESPWD